MAKFLRRALRGEKITEDYETFSVKGFRLGLEVAEPPKILIAALREGMLKLAGRVGDGAILNWLSAEDTKRVAPIVHAGGKDKEIAARIFVCPNPDAQAVRAMARFAVNAYLNVPVYRAYHEWLGRQELLDAMWSKWDVGDRKAAAAAIPDEVVDQLIVHGTPEACREHVQRYVDNGVDTPILAVLPLGVDPRQAARDLAPR
jgi:alkanesulfonate monooxygenase SsuD/methylene tetrahydromethanopterin reductase-like flavin-dependent oxidoreductase (luciferase family)